MTRKAEVLSKVIDRDLKRGAKKIEKAGVLYVDPPWQTKTYGGVALPQRADEPHYPTMSLDDLKALPVGDLAANDCCLFMWIIGSHLDQGFALADAWGFKFNTDAFYWRKITKAGMAVAEDAFDEDKAGAFYANQAEALEELGSNEFAKMGMGKWSRKQIEPLYLFTRGKPSPKPGSRGVRQIIDAPIREHSRKPDEAYDRIEALASGPYVELFARQTRPGWSSWGNQVGKFDAKPACEWCGGTGKIDFRVPCDKCQKPKRSKADLLA